MEVKPGYKQTEVGVIPEDWDARPCSDVSERIMVGIVIQPTQYYVRNGVPAFRSANIREGGITVLDLVFISEKSNALLAKSQTRAGDVLTVRTGYPGTSAVVPPAFAGCNCIDIIITRPSKELSSEYLVSWINSSFGKEQVLRNQGGLAQQHFNVGDLRNLIVALPQLPEQRAIAGALSEVDALIGALDQLIAKKRDLKQAAMQQLLTGHHRLPGFHGEWQAVTAGEIGRFRGGNGFPLKTQGNSEGLFPFYKVSDMNNEGNETFMTVSNNWISEPTRKTLGITPFPENSIVFAKVGAAIFLERKKILTQPSCIDNNMTAFILQADCADYRFVHHLLLATKLAALVATTALPSLNGKQLSEIAIKLPPLPEQTTIAAVLTDMDAELAALEERRAKTRALKQGMMQELLTGRIRLV